MTKGMYVSMDAGARRLPSVIWENRILEYVREEREENEMTEASKYKKTV